MHDKNDIYHGVGDYRTVTNNILSLLEEFSENEMTSFDVYNWLKKENKLVYFTTRKSSTTTRRGIASILNELAHRYVIIKSASDGRIWFAHNQQMR